MTDDPHRRTAALVYAKPESEVTREERTCGKVLNVLAAHGKLDNFKQIAELADVDESEARMLARVFRERVLGITQGVYGD